MIAESVTIVLTNVLAGVFGFIVGQLVQWQRMRVRGLSIVAPVVDARGSKRARLAGMALALLAVLTAVQAMYTGYQQTRHTEWLQERQAEDIACNAYLVNLLQERALIWEMDHYNTTEFVRSFQAANRVEDPERRARAMASAAQRYVDRQDRFDQERDIAPIRAAEC